MKGRHETAEGWLHGGVAGRVEKYVDEAREREVAQQEGGPPLIAVGSRGLAGIRYTRLGSVSTKIITAAERPVPACPHAE